MLNFLATKQAAFRHTYTHRYLFSTPPLEKKRRKHDWKTDVVGLRQNKKESNSTTVKKNIERKPIIIVNDSYAASAGAKENRERVCLLCTVQ